MTFTTKQKRGIALGAALMALGCMAISHHHHHHHNKHGHHKHGAKNNATKNAGHHGHSHHEHGSKNAEKIPMIKDLVAITYAGAGCTGKATRAPQVLMHCSQPSQQKQQPQQQGYMGYAYRNSAYGSHPTPTFKPTETVNCDAICGKAVTATSHKGKGGKGSHHHGMHKAADAVQTKGVCQDTTKVTLGITMDLHLHESMNISSTQYACKVREDPKAAWARAMMCMMMIFYAILFVVYFVGFVVAVTCVAPKQGFSTPLHGCFSDCWSCMITMCCPCLTFGKVAEEHNPRNHWALMALLYACCHNFACCLGIWNRQELRKHRNVNGTVCQDCCIHTFAHPCALCQEYRECEIQATDGGITAPMRPTPMRMKNPMVVEGVEVSIVCPPNVKPGQTMVVDVPQVGHCTADVPLTAVAGQTFVAHASPVVEPPTVVATVVSIQ